MNFPKYMYRWLLPLAFPLFAVIFWHSCAQVGSPSGGPRDTIPPEVLHTAPPNYSTNFNATTVEIEINEYYQIKNRQNAVMISPPMEENPRVVEHGHKLEIRLKDTLRKNTTYTFDFGENIVDLNEGNPLGDFQYVAATGESLDSLRVSGFVVDAFTHRPVEGVEVYLYKRTADSLPRTTLPYYWAPAEKDGNFSVKNIGRDNYKVFALKDANRNHRFDVQSEAIAFLDTLVEPSVQSRARRDTSAADSLAAQYRFLPDNIHLRMFQENKQKQYLKSNKRPLPGKCVFVFNKVLDSLHFIEAVNFADSSDWGMQETTLPNDSMVFWLRDTSVIFRDSLDFRLKYLSRDSLDQPIDITEEVSLGYDTAQTTPPDILELSSNAMAKNKLNPRKPLFIDAPMPIRSVDTSHMELFRQKDSLETPVPFNTTPDSLNLRRCLVQGSFGADTMYTLRLYPGALTGWYGLTHDTTSLDFSFVPEDQYGHLQIHIQDLATAGIFELLKAGKDKTMRKHLIEGDTALGVSYLRPGKYLFRLTADANDDGRWTTGDYSKKRQPEFVHYFQDTVTVKEGWDNKIQWPLNRSIQKRETQK